MKQVAAATEGGQAFLLDGAGNALAHSDERQIGKNYLEESDGPGGIAARRLFTEGARQFEIRAGGTSYTVSVGSLEGGWYSVCLINNTIWHRPVHRVIFLFYAFLVLVMFGITAVLLSQTAQNIALQELHTRVDREEKRGEVLQALSETDRMTGLYDHVSGVRRVGEYLSSGGSGMFLELDIDRFKSINDTYGHQTGDLVIRAMADALRGTFRTNDVLMRLGGDEFGVFAVGITSREMGRSIVQRLFDRLEGFDIPALCGGKIHISAGAVLCREEEPLSFQELYSLADNAMYAGKKVPGNSLVFAGDESRDNAVHCPADAGNR